MSFFGRIASVTIGNPGTTGILVDDLRITFKVSKTSTSKDGNTSEIGIYNMNEQRRNQIDDIKDIVILKAGYKKADGLEVLSIGDITKVSNAYQTPNVLTTINTSDGNKFLIKDRVSISFNEGSGVRQILTKIQNDFSSLGSNLSKVDFNDYTFNNGFAFNGNTKDVLDKLTKIVGINWSIQNNEIRYVKKGESDKTLKIILNPDTGLLYSPERIKLKKGEVTTKENTVGWKVISFLQPKAIPGGQVELSSREVGNNKLFRIINVQHDGDTHEKDFHTTMELAAI